MRGERLDSHVTLHASNGSLVPVDDDLGAGYCSAFVKNLEPCEHTIRDERSRVQGASGHTLRVTVP